LHETLLATAVAASLGWGAGETRAQEKIKLTIPTVQSAFGYTYVAEEKGYFKAEGLDVEILVATGGTSTPALISDSIQYSSSTSSAMSAILKGAPLKIIMVGQSRPIQEIWSFDPAVTKFEDLKGKILATTVRGGTDEIMTRMLLKDRGLPDDYIGYTPLGHGPTRVAAIIAGNVKYAYIGRTDKGDLEKAGVLDKGRMILRFADLLELQTGGLVTTEKELTSNPDRVRRLLRALWKGTIHLQKEPEATLEIMAKKLPKLSPKALRFDYDGAIEDLDTDGTISRDAQMRELATRAELMNVAADKVPPPDRVYDFTIVQSVIRDLSAGGWRP
jgi:NitT/TauT family transport system substrate-binding protein